jgi:hypothetical protein
MRLVSALFSIILLFCSFNQAIAQINQDTIGVTDIELPLKFTKSILLAEPTHFPVRTEVSKTLDWQWENLGPNVQPKELNPGGKAIPTYAAGRGNGTGRINYLVIHPKYQDIMWACSPTGGAWISYDKGNLWTNAGTDKLSISGVACLTPHARKKTTWWLATGDGDDLFQFSDGVWMTKDAGLTYVSMNGLIENEMLPFGKEDDYYSHICDIKSNPKRAKQLIAATNNGLFISDNALKPEKVKWRKVADGYFYSITIINGKSRGKDVIVATGDKFLMSEDGGKTWTTISNPSYPESDQYPFLRMNAQWTPVDPGKLFVVVTCSKAVTQSSIGEGTLFEFDLESKQWKFIRSLRTDMGNVIPTRARAFAVSPTNNGMMCGNVQPLYRSEDRGKTFSKIEKNQMHDDCHHIIYDKYGKWMFASHDGGVSVSMDGGVTWEASDNGIGAANIFGVSTSQTLEPQVLYGGYDVGGNLLKEGNWWHVSWGDGFETIISPSDPKIMFSTMQNGNIQRSDDGRTFETGSNASGAKTEWHTWIRMHPTNNNLVFCSGAKLSRSSDTGKTWKTVFEAPKIDPAIYNAYRFFMSENHPGVMYVYALDTTRIHPQIWRTFNITEQNESLIKWEKVTDIPIEGWIMGIEIDPEDPKKFWMLYGRNEPTGKIWWYDGEKYEDYTSNLGYSKCEALVLQRGPEKRLYLGSNYGVFTRRFGESQWTLMKGLPGVQIKSMAINNTASKLVIGTFGRGVWWGDLIRR